jgi:hypothetical protein
MNNHTAEAKTTTTINKTIFFIFIEYLYHFVKGIPSF